jgi:sulfur-oxidizing protein SoxB
MKTTELTIVQMNDSHGYLDIHPELFWAADHEEYRMAGGYARIATILNEIRRQRPGQVLALDCGDTIHGTRVAVDTKGMALVPVLNALGFDAMTAHWEFAYGPRHFRELVARLPYPMLAINCYDKETGVLTFPPCLVKEAGGVRVGIIGIASNIVDKVMPPSYSEGVQFTLGKEELPVYIDQLKNQGKVDLVLVVSHLGFPQEMKLASEVAGIDVLLSGHTHNRLYRPALVGNTIVIQSGCHGSFLGRLDLAIDAGRIAGFHHELITIDETIAPDREVQQWVEASYAPYRDELNRVVGHTEIGLNRNTILESTMDNLLLQSIRDVAGTPLAFSNGWRYGAPVPPGQVTVNDLYNIIPMDPPVSTVELTGEELKQMMEENLERAFSRDPYEQMGGYVKRCLGVRLCFKVENPPGYRIQEFFVQNKRVDPDSIYSAAFVTAQGVPERFGANRRHLDIRAVRAMRQYLEKRGTVCTSLQGSVVAV